MFCPNCGEKLINPNQKFCQVCGANLKELIPGYAIEEVESNSYSKNALNPQTEIYNQQTPQLQQINKQGIPNKYAKSCFACALISFIIGDITGFLTFPAIYLWPFLILLTILTIIGLTFGILSRTYKKRSEEIEPVSGLRKAGSVLGIIGIVFNSISLLPTLIILMFFFS